MEKWPYLGNSERYRAKVTIDHYINSHIGFQITCKSLTLDDLKGHWQPVR